MKLQITSSLMQGTFYSSSLADLARLLTVLLQRAARARAPGHGCAKFSGSSTGAGAEDSDHGGCLEALDSLRQAWV